MKKSKFTPMEMSDMFPACCYTLLNTTGELIRIDRGEPGYTSYKSLAPDKLGQKVLGFEALEKVNALNAALGISDWRIIEAMEVGSMFGWHVPGARPEIFAKEPDGRGEKKLLEIAKRSEKHKAEILKGDE